jgi:hypothetical protein
MEQAIDDNSVSRPSRSMGKPPLSPAPRKTALRGTAKIPNSSGKSSSDDASDTGSVGSFDLDGIPVPDICADDDKQVICEAKAKGLIIELQGKGEMSKSKNEPAVKQKTSPGERGLKVGLVRLSRLSRLPRRKTNHLTQRQNLKRKVPRVEGLKVPPVAVERENWVKKSTTMALLRKSPREDMEVPPSGERENWVKKLMVARLRKAQRVAPREGMEVPPSGERENWVKKSMVARLRKAPKVEGMEVLPSGERENWVKKSMVARLRKAPKVAPREGMEVPPSGERENWVQRVLKSPRVKSLKARKRSDRVVQRGRLTKKTRKDKRRDEDPSPASRMH